DYTVSGGDGAAGSITLTDALAVGYVMWIGSNRDFTQDQDFIQAQRLTATALDDSVDKLCRLTQQCVELEERMGRFRPTCPDELRNKVIPDFPVLKLLGSDATATEWQWHDIPTGGTGTGGECCELCIHNIAEYDNDLVTAVAAIGAAPVDLWICTAIAPGVDVHVPSNIRLVIPPQGRINPAAGITVTIDKLSAGNYEIFGGAGSIVLTDGCCSYYLMEWFGAVPNDQTVCCGTAATALVTAMTSGLIWVGNGTWYNSLANFGTKSLVHYFGSGMGATVMKQADAANIGVFKSINWDTMVAVTDPGAWSVAQGVHYRFSIQNLSVDGNRDNNASGCGIQVYGKGYYINNVKIYYCPEDGLYSR
ncbi:hypothetical protein, partial [Candidatus Magnetobacterium casense]